MSKLPRKIPQQGEIWLVKFEQIKETRKPFCPCLVISSNSQNEFDEEVIILPLTTEEVISGEVQPFEIPINAEKETGLNEPSWILTNRVHTIDKKLRLIERLGKVDQKIWKRVLVALWVVITGQKEIK